jgi:hypothetical protein
MDRSQYEQAPKRTRGEKLQRLRKQVFATYGDVCWLCGGGEADTIDHLIPLSDGGSDELDNLRPAHGKKSSYCVGNYSRKRPAFVGERPKIVMRLSDQSDGITYGDGWIRKKRGGSVETIYFAVTGMNINDPFVQAFING